MHCEMRLKESYLCLKEGTNARLQHVLDLLGGFDRTPSTPPPLRTPMISTIVGANHECLHTRFLSLETNREILSFSCKLVIVLKSHDTTSSLARGVWHVPFILSGSSIQDTSIIKVMSLQGNVVRDCVPTDGSIMHRFYYHYYYSVV